MKIGIIGAGNIGGTLTRLLSARGHEVAVANSRGPETLAGLAAETGAHAVPVSEVARGAEVVVVAIPEYRVPDLPGGVLDGAAPEAVVIDTGNYYPRRDGRIEPIEAGTTESRWVADELGRPVVKVFNTIYSRVLSEGGTPTGLAGPDRPAARGRRRGRKGRRVAARRRARLRSGRRRRPRRFLAPAAGDAGLRRRPRRGGRPPRTRRGGSHAEREPARLTRPRRAAGCSGRCGRRG